MLAAACMDVRAVPEEIRENFEKVRLTRAEKARNPDAHFSGGVWVFLVIHGFEIPGDKLSEVLIEFSRDDKLVQLLPDGGIVKLVRLDYSVYGPKNVSFK